MGDIRFWGELEDSIEFNFGWNKYLKRFLYGVKVGVEFEGRKRYYLRLME